MARNSYCVKPIRNMLALGAAMAFLAACSGSDDAPAPPANRAPTVTSSATAPVDENASGVVYTATATDADGDPVTFSISGGADAAAFSITTAGALSFVTAPDFEAPGDANGDNIYEVTITAADGSDTTTLNLTVTVTNLPDGFTVVRVATGLSQPVFVTGRGDGSNRIFILERTGQIETLDLDTGLLAATPFLDVSSTISTAGEGGLLGMALAPDFAISGAFFIHVTNTSGDTEIRRYTLSAGDPNLADPASADVIFTAGQFANNHNGGWIGFDDSGLLHIALGDGGGSGDPQGNGQDTNTVLGAMLRIDPSADDFPADNNRDYAIPASNPFNGTTGAPEIFAFGLRNPFRASFDRATGDLYIGDVGQDSIEEIDLIPRGVAGLNFGWNIREGTQTFAGGIALNLTDPIAQYPHGSGPREGNVVTGGYVYRGPVLPLQGFYIFGDFDTANIWAIDTASIAQGTTILSSAFTILTDTFAPDVGSIDMISSFGEDDDGNLFVVDIGGEIFMVAPQ
ncbi:MAG: PQQ-dependent sugar dehydrogenase [Pseudomonadota bacterium]